MADDGTDAGDPACWLEAVCEACGRIPDPPPSGAAPLIEGSCADCRGGVTPPLTDADYRSLAEFRAALRVFLHTSETAARDAGLTPNQHQLLLAIRGWSGGAPPSVSDLAERLQLQVHSTGELLARAEEAGLVVRNQDPGDGRRQRIELTRDGVDRLAALSAFHRDELRSLRRRLVAALTDLDGLEGPDERR
ncbi:MAG: MarR family winged helix-turn-helix transcriptional regulator [Nitriliruptor sp.]